MPGPAYSRKHWLIALLIGALLGATVLGLLFRSESKEADSPGGLAMPEGPRGSSMGSRLRNTALFGSREGISPFGNAGGGDFFQRLAEALSPGASSDQRSRLVQILMADPEVQRQYAEFLATGRLSATKAAEEMKDSGLAERLLARLKESNDPNARRMLVQGGSPEAVLAPTPQPSTPRSAPSARARPTSMTRGDVQAFNHIFSMVPQGQRDRIMARMETGEVVWDACRNAGLTADCNAAVAKCQADTGCTNWLKRSGQALAGEEAGWTKTSDAKSITKPAPKPAELTPASTPPDSAAPGASAGAGPSGGDAGADGAGSASRATPPPPPAPPGCGGCRRNPCQPCCVANGWSCGGSEPPPAPPPASPPPEPAPRPPRDRGEDECFVAGTRVLTPLGPRPIEEIRAGDAVYSVDVETGRRVVNSVEGLVRGVQSRFVRLRLSDGRSLQMTPAHRFYDPGARAWVEAGDLAAGSALSAVEGSALASREEAPLVPATVGEQETLESRPRAVYNLTVSGPHRNYLAEGVLVHNIKRGRRER